MSQIQVVFEDRCGGLDERGEVGSGRRILVGIHERLIKDSPHRMEQVLAKTAKFIHPSPGENGRR